MQFKTTLFLVSLVSLAISCLTPTAFGENNPAPQTTRSLDRIAAVVNQDVITERQLHQTLADFKKHFAQAQAHAPQPNDATLRQQALLRLIYESLQLQLAKKHNVTVDNAAVTVAINAIAKRNHLTPAQLKQNIEAKGMSYATYKKDIRKQMIINKVQQQAVGSNLNVTPHDLQKTKRMLEKLANQHVAYHTETVLIPLPSAPSADQMQYAKTLAKDVATALKQGTSVSEIVKRYADDHVESQDLGWRPPTSLPTIFSKVIAHMTPGQISDPIQAGNGFHVLKLLGKKGNRPQVTPAQIQNIAFRRKLNRALEKWLKAERKKAYVKIMAQ